jgi:hypothetical protein
MHQPQKYGEGFPFPADFRFQTGETLLVRLRVSMNTPGRRDGALNVWIGTTKSRKYRHVLSRADIEWRATRDIALDGLLFQSFYGGGDKTWAPRRPSFTLFSDIATQSLE